MNFKIGDKVRFLNEPGGGVIKKIISPSMVSVAIEDGFEIPTMTSELILSERTEDRAGIFREEHRETPSVEEHTIQEEQIIDTSTRDLKKSRLMGEQDKGIFLALIPHDQKWLVTGLIDIYIVNSTTSDILYNFFLEKDNSISGIDYGSAEPYSMKLIETISREDVEMWCKGYVQVMFHSDKPSHLFLPVNAEYKIRPAQLVRENAYNKPIFMQEKAFLVKLILETELKKVAGNEQAKKFEKDDNTKVKAENQKPKSLISKHRKEKGYAVVDLHIGELVDNISGMSSTDMLNFQLDYFEKCLKSAIENRYHKVTFIHGVGNGTLKYAISEKIKDYSGLENYDASLAKFGVGAIDIIIRYNEID